MVLGDLKRADLGIKVDWADELLHGRGSRTFLVDRHLTLIHHDFAGANDATVRLVLLVGAVYAFPG